MLVKCLHCVTLDKIITTFHQKCNPQKLGKMLIYSKNVILNNTDTYSILHSSWQIKILGYYMLSIRTINNTSIGVAVMSLLLFLKTSNIFSHLLSILHFYIPWKHQKTLWFPDVFRGYRNIIFGTLSYVRVFEHIITYC